MASVINAEQTWVPIPGYEGFYDITLQGQIRSRDKIVEGRPGVFIPMKSILRKCSVDSYGYLVIGLTKDGKAKTHKLHVLLARTFIANPEGKPQVSHINDVKTDNRLENLEWATPKENSQRAKDNDRVCAGSRNGGSKLTEEDILLIMKRLGDGEMNKTIAADFGMSSVQISNIRTGKAWKGVQRG